MQNRLSESIGDLACTQNTAIDLDLVDQAIEVRCPGIRRVADPHSVLLWEVRAGQRAHSPLFAIHIDPLPTQCPAIGSGYVMPGIVAIIHT